MFIVLLLTLCVGVNSYVAFVVQGDRVLQTVVVLTCYNNLVVNTLAANLNGYCKANNRHCNCKLPTVHPSAQAIEMFG
jgi:hypothetical protein